MVVCLLDGLYLNATLPLLTLLLGYSHARCYISLLIISTTLIYTILMRGGNWSYLDFGDSAACVTWVCGG